MRNGSLAIIAVALAFIWSTGAGAGRGPSASTVQATTLPDLTIEMVILGNPSSVTPGQTIPYAMVVTNNGGAMPASSRVLVADELPDQVAYISAVEGARAQLPFFLGVVCSFATPVVSCELPVPLAPGDHFVVRLDVQLSASAVGGNVVNQARVDPLDEVTESRENNNKAMVKVPIRP